MDSAAGAWATAVGDRFVSGPEQARRAVRKMKSAQYSSFGMAMALLLIIGQFSHWLFFLAMKMGVIFIPFRALVTYGFFGELNLLHLVFRW